MANKDKINNMFGIDPDIIEKYGTDSLIIKNILNKRNLLFEAYIKVGLRPPKTKKHNKKRKK